MATQKEVKIVISAQDRASAALRATQGNMRSLNNTMDKVSKGGLRAGESLRAAASSSKVFAGGLVAVGAGALKMALTAARTETLGVAMEAVAKATGTSMEVLKEQEAVLKKQGITTQEARKSLTLFMQSNLDVAQASDIARTAQDLAVIAGEDSSATTARLTDAIATMNPMLLREVGIVKNTEEVFGKYAETLGKSSDDLTEVEKKQALVNLILEEGEKVSGTYEAAMGTAGKKLGSLKRHIEEAMNAIGEVFLPVLGMAIDGITNALKKITPDSVIEFRKKVEKNVPIIAGIILGSLVPAFYALATSTWAAIAPLLPFVAAGAAVGVSVKILIDIFGGWESVLNKLRPVWNNLINTFEEGRRFFDARLKPALSILFSIIETALRPAIEDLKREWEKLLPGLKKLWNLVKPILIPALKVFAAIIGGVVVASILIAIATITLIIGAITKLITFFVRMQNVAIGVATRIGDFWRNVFLRNWVEVKDKVKGAIDGIIQGVVDMKDRLWNSITEMIGTIGVFGQKFVDLYNKLVGNSVITDLVDRTEEEMDRMSEAFNEISREDLLDGVRESMEETKDTAVETSDTIVQSMRDFKDSFDEATGKVKGFYDDIKEANKDFKKTQKENNADYLEGLFDIITGEQEKLSEKKEQLAEEIAKNDEASQKKIGTLQAEIQTIEAFLKKHNKELRKIEGFKKKDAIEKLNARFKEEKRINKKRHKEQKRTLRENIKDIGRLYEEGFTEILNQLKEHKLFDLIKEIQKLSLPTNKKGKGKGKSFQMGTQFVNETGPALLHKGERVVPAGQASGRGFGGTVNINMGGVTVNNEADENRLVDKIRSALNRDLDLSQKGLI